MYTCDEPPDIERLLGQLATAAPVKIIKGPASSAHAPIRLELEGGVEVFVKSSRREEVQQAAAMVRYEVAAWEIARAIGAPRLVPPTVLRSLPVGSGGEAECSVQLAVAGEDNGPLDELSDEDVALAAALDTVIQQLDRARHNWLIAWDDDGVPHPVLIDNGCAFDFDTSDVPSRYDVSGPRSVFIEEAERRGLRLPMERFEVLQQVPIRMRLRDLISEDALNDVLERAEIEEAA